MLARLEHMSATLPPPNISKTSKFWKRLSAKPGARNVAEMDVRPAIAQARVFGFHLATLDIRQNSDYHDRAMAGLFVPPDSQNTIFRTGAKPKSSTF